MLTSLIFKNVFRKIHRNKWHLRGFTSIVNPRALNKNRCFCVKNARMSNGSLIQCRKFGRNDSTEDPVPLLPLFDEPIAIDPSILYTLGNYITTKLIIKPFLDNTFSISEFVTSATQTDLLVSIPESVLWEMYKIEVLVYRLWEKLKNAKLTNAETELLSHHILAFGCIAKSKDKQQAATIVSKALSKEDYETLEGLVVEDLIPRLKEKISALTPQQRELLSLEKKYLLMSFPHYISVNYNRTEENQRSFVNILVAHHYIDSEMPKNDTPLLQLAAIDKAKYVVCNYRYIREYTPGVEDYWKICYINYVKPKSLVEEFKRKLRQS